MSKAMLPDKHLALKPVRRTIPTGKGCSAWGARLRVLGGSKRTLTFLFLPFYSGMFETF